MAVQPTAFHCQVSFNYSNINSSPILTSGTKLKFRISTLIQTLAHTVRSDRNPSSVYRVRKKSVSHAFQQIREDCCDQRNDTLYMFKRWLDLIRGIFQVGSWWNLSDFEQNVDASPSAAKPMTVSSALSQIWALVADERWILFTAFGALTVAAVSEISMPGILAASVFSAQNGEMLGFYQNSRLLVFLCLTSGICSGLRSGCFAVANMILVKRLRKTVYNSLLLQDISFFDTAAVGNLTSRISSDCQRLSRIIGHDIHLILRNILQGVGAFISLMTLSRPLALSSLAICFILSVIFLIYGQYQMKAALLAQNFVASANEVAQETLSFMRTVRTYGTEREEFERYTQWNDRLASVGMRESAANGLWTLSFHILYRSTQVLAVILGGLSIFTGHVSAEQLTKYVLYCEWLIYAVWRLQDSMSSLFQSVGACEKVFRLMHLSPSLEFVSGGVKLPKLTGPVGFVNVSFHYPSRKMAYFYDCKYIKFRLYHRTELIFNIPYTYEQVPILESANFSIKANEAVAIVGVSGSGKSTLINLLLGLYDLINGEILVDSTPLREMDMRWLRENIGFVGQEPHLFHMDVKSNIGYGCSRRLGQERIAIARALVRDPTILVLDEATSALDAESEGYLKEVLRSLKNDPDRRRTIIIVAQRLSTVKAADRILVLDNGQVVESGTHTELVDRNGPYFRLFKAQIDPQPFINGQKDRLVEQ